MTIFFFLLILFCSLTVGCSDEPAGNNVVFTVDVSNINAYSATITVTHNATNRDIYYGFAVEGEVNDINDEIQRFRTSADEATLNESRHNQRKSVFTVSKLIPGQTMTYIVFGMNDDGALFGKPASVRFRTAKSDIKASVNPDWSIRYKGHTVYNLTDYSLITVSLKADATEHFILATYEADDIKRFTTTEDLLTYSARTFVEDKSQSDDFWLEDSQVRTGATDFFRYLQPGDYVSYAVGVNNDGTPTGHYVCTEPYHVDKYPATPEYANLLDEWVIIDENDKWYFVTFTERVVNRSLTMTGWGNYDAYPISVTFSRIDGSFKIGSQVIFNEGTHKHSDGTVYTGSLSFRGAYYNLDSKLGWTSTSLNLVNGKRLDDDFYTLTSGFSVKLSDGSRTYDTGVTFVFTQEDDSKFGFARMMFPLKMKKLSTL